MPFLPIQSGDNKQKMIKCPLTFDLVDAGELVRLRREVEQRRIASRRRRALLDRFQLSARGITVDDYRLIV